jgi:hypothetical protein
MARPASVRLTLENSQFIAQLKRANEGVTRMAQEANKALRDQFGAGADAAKRSISGLAGSLKTAATMAITFGGAFSVGNALRDTAKLQGQYRQVAFGIRDANGQLMKSADVQRLVERAAAKTGQTNGDMLKSFKDLRAATGDLDFARGAIQAVGTASLATGGSLETFGALADQLHTKFGITSDEMLDAFAQVHDAAGQGGPALEEFAAVASDVGSELLGAGLDGKRGLDFMLGALVATDDKFKNLPKQVAGLKGVLRSLSEGGDLDKIGGKIGIDPKKLLNEKDVLARLRMILSKGMRGIDAVRGAMGNKEERDTLDTLFIDPFREALADAEKSGLKGKAAIDAALVTFDTGLDRLGKAQLTGAQMQEEANRARSEPEQRLKEALNRLQTAFGRPEIIAAIDKITDHLPQLADMLATIVATAAEHPIAAGVAGVAGKVGVDALGTMASGAVAAGGTALWKKMMGKGAATAAKTAAPAAVGLVGRLFPSLAGIVSAGGAGAAGAGAGTGAGLAGGGAAAGAGLLGALALPLTAIALGGAAAGYGVDKAYSKEGDVMRELSDATLGANAGGGINAKREQLERLQAAFTAAGNAEVGEGLFDAFARKLTGVDSRKQAEEQMALAGEAITKLAAQIEKMSAPVPAAEAAAKDQPKQVTLDQHAPRLIAQAVKDGLNGLTLNVAVSTGSGIGKVYTGGSRGPMSTPPARQGGGV